MFCFPPQYDGKANPVWTGSGFQIGNEYVPVLSYGESQSGWNDDLTLLHEDNAGSNHFIDLASREHAMGEIHRWLPTGEKPVIMDVGCSSGFMLREYREKLPGVIVMGADVVRGPLERLAVKLPDVPLLHFDLVRCPLPDNFLDGISLINVLEHIEDDRTALKQVYRILKPGGVAVIEVPAGPGLYDSYDRMLMHHRRYILTDLVKSATSIGFRVVSKSHLGAFLYPGFWLVKKKNRLVDTWQPGRSVADKAKQDEATITREIRTTSGNLFLQWCMKAELKLGKMFNYPFGIRCLITIIKP